MNADGYALEDIPAHKLANCTLAAVSLCFADPATGAESNDLRCRSAGLHFALCCTSDC